jgi:hypothetical protein
VSFDATSKFHFDIDRGSWSFWPDRNKEDCMAKRFKCHHVKKEKATIPAAKNLTTRLDWEAERHE